MTFANIVLRERKYSFEQLIARSFLNKQELPPELLELNPVTKTSSAVFEVSLQEKDDYISNFLCVRIAKNKSQTNLPHTNWKECYEVILVNLSSGKFEEDYLFERFDPYSWWPQNTFTTVFTTPDANFIPRYRRILPSSHDIHPSNLFDWIVKNCNNLWSIRVIPCYSNKRDWPIYPLYGRYCIFQISFMDEVDHMHFMLRWK